MHAISVVAFLSIAASALGASIYQEPKCRCLPHDSCWPSASEWNDFNTTVSGNLIAVHPIAAVCHAPHFNNESCAVVQENYHDSFYRASFPGAYQQVNFETSAVTNETCYPDTPVSVPCGQGSVPVYAVAAHTANDIQQTVNFAKARNLRLVIKNTGHDYLGRSAGRGSLEIWTHNMKDKTLHSSFTPENCTAAPQEAITVGAGVQLHELYDYLLPLGKMVVGGFASTVGVAGGYIQGGGHSALGPYQGMAVDNALQFTIVTADGKHRVANACQNSDLFWALRGGGGGTWGVITSLTLRTFDDPPVLFGGVNFSVPLSAGEDVYWGLVAKFHAALPALSDAGCSGYYWTYPNASAAEPALGRAFVSLLFFANQTDPAVGTKAMSGFLAEVQSVTNQTQAGWEPVPSMGLIYNTYLSGPEATGENIVIGSRLISRNLLSSEDGPSRLVSAFRKVNNQIGGIFVGGGKVAANADLDVALNPAWRKTLTHIVFSGEWDDSASFEEVEEIQNQMTEVEVPLLKELEKDMGAYNNEADFRDPDWQWDFWGTNYPRLLEVKSKWDPENLFRCHPCVGAEKWDKEGICLV